MKVLQKYVSFEEKIKNSLFLSEIFPCESQNQARQILKEQKEMRKRLKWEKD